MLDKFQEEFKAAKITFNQKILVAVSGGVDSMVLWHMMYTAKKIHGVAHVNFGMRGKESDGDETMVKNQANEWNIPFHSLKADTRAYARKRGISIQMAAREIRYDFFEELFKEKGYDVLATAHHLQDNIETLLMNLNRGTGIKGLYGIVSDKNKFRPMLCFTKKEIRDYAHEHEVPYREDASNKETKYDRNWFRHEVIAPWQERNPNFFQQMHSNFERFREANELLDEYIKEKTNKVQKQLKKGHVSFEELKELKPRKLMLRFLFTPYGFNQSQLDGLNKCLQAKQVGKQFFTKTHALTVDRSKLLLSKINEVALPREIYWEVDEQTKLTEPVSIQTKNVERFNFKFSPSKLKEGFDVERLSFPLRLRRWREGDKMRPLGMKGMKKVSDILIDEKIALPDKKNVYVLTSAGKIVWLVGIKPDDRFKVIEQTTKIIEISTR